MNSTALNLAVPPPVGDGGGALTLTHLGALCGPQIGAGPFSSTVPDFTPCFQSLVCTVPSVIMIVYTSLRAVGLALQREQPMESSNLSAMTMVCLSLLVLLPLAGMASQDLLGHAAYYNVADCGAWAGVTVLLIMLANRKQQPDAAVRVFVGLHFLIYAKFIESAVVAMSFEVLDHEAESMTLLTIIQAFLTLNLCVFFSTGHTSGEGDMEVTKRQRSLSFPPPLNASMTPLLSHKRKQRSLSFPPPLPYAGTTATKQRCQRETGNSRSGNSHFEHLLSKSSDFLEEDIHERLESLIIVPSVQAN